MWNIWHKFSCAHSPAKRYRRVQYYCTVLRTSVCTVLYIHLPTPPPHPIHTTSHHNTPHHIPMLLAFPSHLFLFSTCPSCPVFLARRRIQDSLSESFPKSATIGIGIGTEHPRPSRILTPAPKSVGVAGQHRVRGPMPKDRCKFNVSEYLDTLLFSSSSAPCERVKQIPSRPTTQVSLTEHDDHEHHAIWAAMRTTKDDNNAPTSLSWRCLGWSVARQRLLDHRFVFGAQDEGEDEDEDEDVCRRLYGVTLSMGSVVDLLAFTLRNIQIPSLQPTSFSIQSQQPMLSSV